MYKVSKKMEISACHHLELGYDSKCKKLHGHNWIVTVYCQSMKLNEDGMVCDFTKIKELIHDRLDHGYLNNLLPFNPTAENIAKWIVDTVPLCYKADVRESEMNVASYELDEDEQIVKSGKEEYIKDRIWGALDESGLMVLASQNGKQEYTDKAIELLKDIYKW